MNFESGSIYHVYNRGNNKQVIFFTRANYLFFLNKVRNEITPIADIISYCLMPNHYHLMIQAKELSNDAKHPLSRKLGTLQSSYTRAINIQENRTGSLFQQKTKAVEIYSLYNYYNKNDYLTTCFHYIHQNPLKAGLVMRMEDWEYSSFRDYAGFRKDTLINMQLAREILDIDWENFSKDSYCAIEENKIRSIL